MLRRWCLGVTVVIWTSLCAPLASAQQPPLPGTPTVTVPPVTVPQVTVPPVTVPPTPVTPEVTTPPVQTPTVTTPSVSTSSGAANGGGGESGSGDGQSSSGPGSGAGQSGSGQASGAGQSGPGQSGAGQSGTGQPSGTGASGADASGSSSGDDPGNAPAQLRDRDRDLRRTVLGHEACLGQMPRGERRVLTLRAGVGLAHPRSRAQVQRITGLPRTRVVAIERRGLKRLRVLAQAGGCAGASSAGPARVDATGVGAAGLPQTADRVAFPKISVLGGRESSASRTPSPPPPASSPDAGRPLLHAPDSAVDLAPVLLFVLLGALVFGVVREARRSA
jgi:hypothetical protein